jgi:hypothetical protein
MKYVWYFLQGALYFTTAVSLVAGIVVGITWLAVNDYVLFAYFAALIVMGGAAGLVLGDNL